MFQPRLKAFRKFEQGAGTFGELKAVDDLMLHIPGMATDEVAHMLLAISLALRSTASDTASLHLVDQSACSVRLSTCKADKDEGLLRGRRKR